MGGAVQGEEDEGAHAEDDGALAKEGAGVRPLVNAGVRRPGEVDQGVQQEGGGGAHQVEEQGGGLHVMVTLSPVLCKVVEHNHKIHSDHQHTVTTRERPVQNFKIVTLADITLFCVF